MAPFASLTRLVEARVHRASRRLGLRLALIALCVLVGLIVLGFGLTAATVALAQRYGLLPALGIMAGGGIVILLALLLALAEEKRRHRRVAARQQMLDRQLFHAAAESMVPQRMPSRPVAGLALVAIGSLLVLMRRGGRDGD